MSKPPKNDGGESPSNEPYIADSGRCRIIAPCKLTCVDTSEDSSTFGGYIGVTFEVGEVHAFDRLGWKNKDDSHSYGFVLRTGDGDAYLMPYLFEQYCEIVRERIGLKK